MKSHLSLSSSSIGAPRSSFSVHVEVDVKETEKYGIRGEFGRDESAELESSTHVARGLEVR